MRIDSQLHINLARCSYEQKKALIAALTYPNPKFEDAKRLGFSTKFIQPAIQNFKIRLVDNTLTTSRGEIRKVRAILPDEPIEEDPSFKTTYIHNIKYENKDFELDSRQLRAVEAISKKKQGIIHAATSAGKSAIVMGAIGAINLPTLVIVHRKVLLSQLLTDAKKWLRGCSIGQIGDGECNIQDVTFAIDKSLKTLLERDKAALSRFQAIFQDECHLAPATTFQDIISKLPAARRYGLTGTLKRKDRMEFLIYATYGEVIATITKDELIAADRVSPVELNIIETEAEAPIEFNDLPTTQRWQKTDKYLHQDADRTMLIVDHVRQLLLNPNARIVILSRYVEPTEDVAKTLESLGVATEVVNGQRDDAADACGRLERGDARVMCATIGCFSTGVNIPTLTDIVLISPIFNNELLIHQIRGRLFRKAEGKTHGTLHFIWDPYVFPNRNLNRFKSIMKK